MDVFLLEQLVFRSTYLGVLHYILLCRKLAIINVVWLFEFYFQRIISSSVFSYFRIREPSVLFENNFFFKNQNQRTAWLNFFKIFKESTIFRSIICCLNIFKIFKESTIFWSIICCLNFFEIFKELTIFWSIIWSFKFLAIMVIHQNLDFLRTTVINFKNHPDQHRNLFLFLISAQHWWLSPSYEIGLHVGYYVHHMFLTFSIPKNKVKSNN